MCLREGDGTVDSDIDLLAAGHFDILVRISEDYTRRPQDEKSLKRGAAHQVAIAVYAAEDCLCSRGAVTNIRGAVAARGSANAENQAGGFDQAIIRRLFDLYRDPENGVRARRGGSQLVVNATVQKLGY